MGASCPKLLNLVSWIVLPASPAEAAELYSLCVFGVATLALGRACWAPFGVGGGPLQSELWGAVFGEPFLNSLAAIFGPGYGPLLAPLFCGFPAEKDH